MHGNRLVGDAMNVAMLSQTRSAETSRPHPMRQTAKPAPASSGGSPPSCSSAPATANAPGSLMLFQVVSIQPSERWTCDVRDPELVDTVMEARLPEEWL